jgi:hypothetical protein
MQAKAAMAVWKVLTPVVMRSPLKRDKWSDDVDLRLSKIRLFTKKAGVSVLSPEIASLS